MKKSISTLLVLPLAGLLAGTLAACSLTAEPAPPVSQDSSKTAEYRGNDGSGEEPPENSSGPSENGADPSGQRPEGAAPPAADADHDRREAFAALLRTAHDNLILPDGSPLGGSSMTDVEGNLFTVCDVDGDGQEELILIWSNTITAGMTELVYGYDSASGELVEELREFPGVIFYNNGIVEAPWSHNQGLAGDFWPYNLYQYNAASGQYESAGSVDAWDSAFDSNIFPADADADGNGMVYYLLPPDWNGQYNAPVDDAEYVQWRDSYIKGAGFLDLTFVPLTAENIAQTLGVSFTALADTLPES